VTGPPRTDKEIAEISRIDAKMATRGFRPIGGTERFAKARDREWFASWWHETDNAQIIVSSFEHITPRGPAEFGIGLGGNDFYEDAFGRLGDLWNNSTASMEKLVRAWHTGSGRAWRHPSDRFPVPWNVPLPIAVLARAMGLVPSGAPVSSVKSQYAAAPPLWVVAFYPPTPAGRTSPEVAAYLHDAGVALLGRAFWLALMTEGGTFFSRRADWL